MKSDMVSGMGDPCCMIVEDQALIGMSLEAFLEDAGFSVAGPFPSCADALRWLEHNTPQVAVLDVSLRDGTSLPIAQTLKGRNTPFAIYSGLPFTQPAGGTPGRAVAGKARPAGRAHPDAGPHSAS
jgi:CheY-like chemotaxis protein